MHMLSSRLIFALAVLGTLPTLAAAAEPAWLGAADCRIAPLEGASAEASWSGGCVDSYASGKGVLAWTSPVGKVTIEATLVRGEVSGDAVLKLRHFIYEGALRKGAPNGQGYAQVEGWGWYEGEFANGLPHGKGSHVQIDRSRYTGDWVNGKRHGQGEATFATGGSYTGAWKNDRFDGQGKIVYAGSGRSYEGAFADGRIAGQPKAEIEETNYSFDGAVAGSAIPENGVLAYLPMDAAWDELTPAQKNKVRRNYAALEAGDEPPFPAKGEGPLMKKVHRMNQTFGAVRGTLGVYVLVGKDGKPLSVTAYGAPTATIVRALSTLFMLEPFKPARCRGEPCEMIYPVNFSFSVTD